MAMSGSWEVSWESNYFDYSANTKWYHWSGNWTRSGNTISLTNMRLWLTFRYASYAGEGSYSDSVRVRKNGTSPGYSTYYWPGWSSSTTSSSVNINDYSFSVNATDSSATVIMDIEGEYSYDSLGLSFSSAPTGLNITNITPLSEGFSATVSISGWGGEGSSSTRYRELNVYTYSSSGTVEPRRHQSVSGNSLSGTITTNNSSSGSLNIVGNTRYVIAGYATNGQLNTGMVRFTDAVTLAYAPTITLNSAQSSSLVINYSQPADGGYYTKYLEYSLDGTNWTSAATLTGASAQTGTFTISGLSASTTYTIQIRTRTTSGSAVGTSLQAKTKGPNTPTATVSLLSGSETSTARITFFCTNFNSGTNPYFEVYGQDYGSSTWTLLETVTNVTAGTFYYFNDVMGGNRRRRYKVIAYATFDGVVAASDDRITSYVTTYVPQATLSGSLGDYSSYNKVNATLGWDVPSDYNARAKQLGYRYSIDDGSTWTDWVYVTTISSGSATTYEESLVLDTNTTYIFEGCSLQSVTNARTLSTPQVTLATPDDHRNPTNFDYSTDDNTSSVSDWLSDFSGYTSNMFIQNKSVLRVTIPDATKGTFYDDATLQSYSFSALGQTITILPPVSYPKTQVFSSSFDTRPTDLAYNEVTLAGRVTDTLSAYTNTNKTLILMSYENPTLVVSGERLAKMGEALVDFSGTYARVQNNLLNNGEDVNSIKVEYRVLDIEENVLVGWTETDNFTTTIDSQKPFLRDYSGRATISGIPIDNTAFIDIRVTEHFTSVTQRVELGVWDVNQFASPTEYDIELWDWKTNSFIADLSYLVIGSINMEWTLNDVEQVSFDLDLLRYEEKCIEMGLDPNDLLVPYKHDIKIRRNGIYILGCNLVEANIQLTTEPPAKIQVKGTGYLNLFKDQYILGEAWSGYTYAQIARRLVEAAQKPDCLIKNPTIDIDTSYWLAASGTISYSTSAHSGSGALAGNRSGTGWITYGSQMSVNSGQTISIDMWVKGKSGDIVYIREREYMTKYDTQRNITQLTMDGNWQHIQVASYTTGFSNGYLLIESNRTDSSTLLTIDDCYVYEADDTTTLSDLYITLGTDSASSVQSATRQVNYELQNVKDAIIDLTEQEDDNFDFEFTPERIFNVMARKGSDKLNLEICYPGNVSSMTITRSASNLANKIIAIGSGIGDERLQTMIYDNASRGVYGTHESILTDNNESILANLSADAQGVLRDRKNPTNLPQVVIKDGSVNPSVVQTGDVVLVELKNDTFLSSTTGTYRVIKLKCEVEEESETTTLTLEEE